MNNSHTKSLIATITILILSIIYGCFPAEKGIPNYTISDEFSSYCWFDTTSIWVYQNDSTLSLDSIIIDDVTNKQRQNIINSNYFYQAVEMFPATNFLSILKYELTAGDFSPAEGEMNSLLRIYFEDGTYQIVFSPEYPIGEEVILGDLIGNYTNVEIIPSFNLHDNTYNNVYHTRVVISAGSNIEFDYWIAPNYGIIKYVANVNGTITSLSLKSSNLYQEPK